MQGIQGKEGPPGLLGRIGDKGPPGASGLPGIPGGPGLQVVLYFISLLQPVVLTNVLLQRSHHYSHHPHIVTTYKLLTNVLLQRSHF